MKNRIGKWYVHAESTPRCPSGCGADCYSIVRDDAESSATIATEIMTVEDANLIAAAEQLLRAAKQAVKEEGNWKQVLTWAVVELDQNTVADMIRERAV